jgi:UPF0755 protein
MARRRKRPGRLRRLLALAVACLLLLALAWLHETRVPPLPIGAPARTLVIAPGASVIAIGQRLAELGFVRHPLIFRLATMERGAGARLKAGEYLLESSLSLQDVIDRLTRGEVVHRVVTFPEGKTIDEMARLVAAQAGLDSAAFLAAARDPAPIRDLDPEATDLEGYLFPDTYSVTPTSDAAVDLVGRMLRQFRTVMTPHLVRVRDRKLSLRQLVTLASLVELETAQASERPRIAAVFLNRLDKKMLLQTDPTVIFALRKAGGFDGNIRKADLMIDSPYNTYRHPGLPPGPIACPGREALLAVLQPAPVADLYFVSRNDGSHEFNVTLEQHERAVTRYQRRRGATSLNPAAPTAAPRRRRLGATVHGRGRRLSFPA